MKSTAVAGARLAKKAKGSRRAALPGARPREAFGRRAHNESAPFSRMSSRSPFFSLCLLLLLATAHWACGHLTTSARTRTRLRANGKALRGGAVDSAADCSDLSDQVISDASLGDGDLVFRDEAVQQEWQRFVEDGVPPTPTSVTEEMKQGRRNGTVLTLDSVHGRNPAPSQTPRQRQDEQETKP